MEIDNIIDQLKRDEGLRLTAYKDSRGVLTIGYGRNLDARREAITGEITEQQADQWLLDDINSVQLSLFAHLLWTRNGIDVVRLGVLTNLCFNVGIGALLGFRKTLSAMTDGDYELAAMEMLDSDWAKQVGDRAKRLAEQMKTGQWV